MALSPKMTTIGVICSTLVSWTSSADQAPKAVEATRVDLPAPAGSADAEPLKESVIIGRSRTRLKMYLFRHLCRRPPNRLKFRANLRLPLI